MSSFSSEVKQSCMSTVQNSIFSKFFSNSSIAIVTIDVFLFLVTIVLSNDQRNDKRNFAKANVLDE